MHLLFIFNKYLLIENYFFIKIFGFENSILARITIYCAKYRDFKNVNVYINSVK